MKATSLASFKRSHEYCNYPSCNYMVNTCWYVKLKKPYFYFTVCEAGGYKYFRIRHNADSHGARLFLQSVTFSSSAVWIGHPQGFVPPSVGMELYKKLTFHLFSTILSNPTLLITKMLWLTVFKCTRLDHGKGHIKEQNFHKNQLATHVVGIKLLEVDFYKPHRSILF